MYKKTFKYGAVIIDGHVQGLSNVRSLGERGIPIIVIDNGNCIARYSKYCKKFFRCPSYNSDKFIRFLLDIGEKENLYGWTLFPSNDHIVYNLSAHKEELSKIYKIIVPSFNSLIKIYDKFDFLTSCKNLNIPIPKTFLCNHLTNLNSLPYPLLIKGREGFTFFKAAGKKAFVARNSSELIHILNKLKKIISPEKILLQEIIPFVNSSDVWSYTGFSVEGETKTFWIGKKLREHPTKFGTATLAISDYNDSVEKFGKKIIEMLKYTGVCEIEFVKDKNDGNFKLIEMNPRTWLWVGLAKYCGINYALMTYNYMNNIPFKYPKNYLTGVRWINHTVDFLFAFISILKRNLTLKDYIESLKGNKIRAIYSKDDPTPSIMFFLLFVYIAFKRA